MLLDLNLRPELPPQKLAAVTNTLAHWLPGTLADTDVLAWDKAAWHGALWVVYWQNALPWLADRVREIDATLPPAAAQTLAAIDSESRSRSRRMLDNAVELTGALAEHKVTTLLLKGAALAVDYYPQPEMRPLADLDLLIHKKDLAVSLTVLEKLGYAFYSRSAEDEVYLRGERKTNIWAADNVHPVELHYTLREEYAGIGYNLASLLWAQSAERPYWQYSSACCPHRFALLLHVCAHASSDWLIQRGRLMHIDDIRRLVWQMEPDDWDQFIQAIRPHNARFVFPALAFAARYAQLALPAAVLTYFEEHCPPNLLAWIAQTELADNSESNPTSRSGLGFDLARRLARHRRDRLAFWLRSFFPRRWNLSKRYPRLTQTPFWPLGYVLLNADRVRHMLQKRLQ